MLQKVPLFSHVRHEHLEQIAALMTLRTVPPGEPLCHQGEEGDEVYLVVQGKAIVVAEEDGQREERAVLQRGSCVGEMSILACRPRNATVLAGDEGLEVLVLSGSDFREVLRREPEIGLELFKVLCERIHA